MFLLAGDIGGTKTILRLVEVTEVTLTEKTFKTVREAQYISASFPDLVPMVREFLAQDRYIKPQLACFAIAGPVVNNTCNLTNLHWMLDTKRLQIELDIPKIDLLNDFAANSFGILGLKDFDVHTLQAGEAREDSPIAVIGAGTGLGEAFLVPQGKKYQIFASEGGHTDFAPRNDLEMDLLTIFTPKVKSRTYFRRASSFWSRNRLNLPVFKR